MSRSNRCSFVRACLLSASFSLALAPAAFADVIEPVATLPPANGVYFVGATCISAVCLQNIQLKNFVITSNMIVGGNDVTVSDVDLTANVFQNVGGNPGLPIGSLLLAGQVDITYFSRNSITERGTFNDQITSLTLSGSFAGHTADAMLNPAHQSVGQTTIAEVPGTRTFGISSFFDVFAELSINGGPFVPGPERTGDLGEAPEPSYYVPIGLGLAAIVVRRRYARAKLLTSPRLRIPAC